MTVRLESLTYGMNAPEQRSRNSCPVFLWRKLPACGKYWHRKLEAHATNFSNDA